MARKSRRFLAAAIVEATEPAWDKPIAIPCHPECLPCSGRCACGKRLPTPAVRGSSVALRGENSHAFIRPTTVLAPSGYNRNGLRRRFSFWRLLLGRSDFATELHRRRSRFRGFAPGDRAARPRPFWLIFGASGSRHL